eukprot:m.355658 g.355658  ORF g.355658 m.355658 type:complete len:464 (+) comp17301_c0_seq1:121-1512(+)
MLQRVGTSMRRVGTILAVQGKRWSTSQARTAGCLEELASISNIKSYQMCIDYSKSQGNYVTSGDKTYLDCVTNIASLPLGYNHKALKEAVLNPEWQLAQIHRPALGILPPTTWPDLIKRTLLSVNPKGLDRVQTMMCGSCANENAYKAACLWYMRNKRGGREYNDEEQVSSLINQEPGCPKLSIMSFEGAFHGRTFGCLATTHSKPIHKLDVPTFDWPMAPFPTTEEAVGPALDRVRQLIEEYESKAPVAAIVVEPIQGEGGDRHAPASFFRGLRAITKETGIAFIVDEVQSGVLASGTFWAHEQWGCDPPDIVTFAKKMQISGYYTTEEFAPTYGFQIFNTWVGDPSALYRFEVVLDVIKKENLQERVVSTGKVLLDGLNALSAKYPNTIQNVRGVGTLCAFDVPTQGNVSRDAFIGMLREEGLLISGCGKESIRFRPSLIFDADDANVALGCIDRCAAAVN